MSLKAAATVASSSIWWEVGAVSGATAIAFGAFGAHALKNYVKDEKLLKTWETGAHYHLLHSVALLAVPFSRRPNLVGGLLTTGVLLFSGSLYTIVLTDKKNLGIITPIGGVAMIAGWLALLL